MFIFYRIIILLLPTKNDKSLSSVIMLRLLSFRIAK
nr:MAG TPA: hypothetical protein [Caudoviricetes sp.]